MRPFLRLLAALLCGSIALASATATAHEARSAYLEIIEIAAGRFDVLWRTPILAGTPLPIELRLPPAFGNIVPPHVRQLADSVVERRVVDTHSTPLAGQRLEFPGLEMTITDVLVRVAPLHGAPWTALVKPGRPWLEITPHAGAFAISGAYVAEGVQHILLGFDHLLFVFALMLLVHSRWTLVKTITSFTAAHSITLALATLGVIHVPAVPVEATIALSILLLATEVARMGHGKPTLTSRFPWAVAFTFGLLHGLGFAGALSQIGLPPGDVPLALLSFNVGVELGQLAFVGTVLLARHALQRATMPIAVARLARPAAYYAIGTLSAYWFFDRLSGFWV